MTVTILGSAFVAGATYTLIPGPAFLALLGIGAAHGRRAGAGFVIGHLAGDVVWSSLSLIAIIGAHAVGHGFFDGLGLICGALSLLARRQRAARQARRDRATDGGAEAAAAARAHLRADQPEGLSGGDRHVHRAPVEFGRQAVVVGRFRSFSARPSSASWSPT